MTHAERKELREKHLNLTTADGQFCVGCALISGRATYLDGLCEVIKLLDATEPATDCTHIIGLMTLPKGWDVIEHGQTSFAFNYCPKCGEKL